jgi:peroxiredoxin
MNPASHMRYHPRVAVLAVFYLAMATAACAVESEKAAAKPESPAVPYLTLLIARDPAVHTELGLSTRQIERVDGAVAEVDHSFWLLRDVPVAQCSDQLDALLQKLRGGLKQVLEDAQQRRLDEIILQARGFNGLVAPETVSRLGLSDDQVAQLRSIARTNVRGSKASSSETEPATPKIDARQLMEVLTSQQADQWGRAFGQPFDLARVRQVGCAAPELRSVDDWINSQPTTLKSLRGNVVVLHFWAFGCSNCVHNLPHYQSWYEKLPSSKVKILGIHTPETDRERVVGNLRENVAQRGIKYPVAVDTEAENWKAWGNHMWPSVYLIDKRGLVRNWWYGELNWQGARGEEFMRGRIADLLAEK